MDFLYCSDVDIRRFLPTKIGRFKKQIEDELEMSAQILFMKRKKSTEIASWWRFENQLKKKNFNCCLLPINRQNFRPHLISWCNLILPFEKHTIYLIISYIAKLRELKNIWLFRVSFQIQILMKSWTSIEKTWRDGGGVGPESLEALDQ